MSLYYFVNNLKHLSQQGSVLSALTQRSKMAGSQGARCRVATTKYIKSIKKNFNAMSAVSALQQRIARLRSANVA